LLRLANTRTFFWSLIVASSLFWFKVPGLVFAVRVHQAIKKFSLTAVLQEHRSYQLASGEEVDKKRLGVNIDTGLEQDFGPTLLVPKVSGETARLGA
jgi:hypothetical protein